MGNTKALEVARAINELSTRVDQYNFLVSPYWDEKKAAAVVQDAIDKTTAEFQEELATNQQLADILTLCGEPECFAVEDPVEKLRALIEGLITLRTQLAEQDALTQKHLSTITSLEAAVKERDAQLAAERDVVRQLSKALNVMTWSKEMVDAWHRAMPDMVEGFRQLHLAAVAPLATRQPTQDKGE